MAGGVEGGEGRAPGPGQAWGGGQRGSAPVGQPAAVAGRGPAGTGLPPPWASKRGPVQEGGPRARRAGRGDRVSKQDVLRNGWGRNETLSLASLYWVTCWRFSYA